MTPELEKRKNESPNWDMPLPLEIRLRWVGVKPEQIPDLILRGREILKRLEYSLEVSDEDDDWLIHIEEALGDEILAISLALTDGDISQARIWFQRVVNENTVRTPPGEPGQPTYH